MLCWRGGLDGSRKAIRQQIAVFERVKKHVKNATKKGERAHLRVAGTLLLGVATCPAEQRSNSEQVRDAGSGANRTAIILDAKPLRKPLHAILFCSCLVPAPKIGQNELQAPLPTPHALLPVKGGIDAASFGGCKKRGRKMEGIMPHALMQPWPVNQRPHQPSVLSRSSKTDQSTRTQHRHHHHQQSIRGRNRAHLPSLQPASAQGKEHTQVGMTTRRRRSLYFYRRSVFTRTNTSTTRRTRENRRASQGIGEAADGPREKRQH